MKNHLQAGFTLIEVAITLIILGILAGAAMPSIIRYKQQASMMQTKNHQEMVGKAVAAYELVSERLPCPADPAAQGQNIGLSRQFCNSAETSIGIVPYRTLGIPAQYARDGYKRYMTYVVPPYHGENDVCRFHPANPLIVLDEGGEVSPGGNYVALLLISHGPLGQGAFTNGGQKIQSSDAGRQELANADNSLTFYALPYNMGNTPFRHVAFYMTRDFLRSYANKPCTANETQGDNVQNAGNPF